MRRATRPSIAGQSAYFADRLTEAPGPARARLCRVTTPARTQPLHGRSEPIADRCDGTLCAATSRRVPPTAIDIEEGRDVTAARPRRWLCVVLMLAGCASEPLQMRFEANGSDGRVWPAPQTQEVPRYRYVGQLTGEDNFKPANAEPGTFKRALQWLVGLTEREPNPLVLQRPQTGTVDARGRVLVTDVSRAAVFVFDEGAGRLDLWERAGAGQRADGQVQGGLAAGGGDRAGPAFEGRHALLEYGVGRVADAAVDMTRTFEVEQRGRVLAGVEDERGRQMDGQRARAGRRVGRRAGVQRQRVESGVGGAGHGVLPGQISCQSRALCAMFFRPPQNLEPS